MAQKWKVLNKKTIFKRPYAEVQNWLVRLPSDQKKIFFMNKGGDFVMVFGLTKNKKAVLINQFYINCESYQTSLVAGYMNSKEKPIQAAKREFLEETGYKAKKIVALGKGIKGKYFTGTVYYFLALDAERAQDQQLEPAEDIEVRLVSLETVLKMLKKNVFNDVFAEVGVRRALDYLQRV